MKFCLFIILITIFNIEVFGNEQYPDRILYNGNEYNLNVNPLEAFFDKFPQKRPKAAAISPKLWRGYIATFEIKDNQLLVKDITIEYWQTSDKGENILNSKSILNEIFSDKSNTKVDWFTGLLLLLSENPNNAHPSNDSSHIKYTILEIKKGRFKKSKQFKSMELDKYRDRQFELFKHTKPYRRAKARLKKSGHSDDTIDFTLRRFVLLYSSKFLAD